MFDNWKTTLHMYSFCSPVSNISYTTSVRLWARDEWQLFPKKLQPRYAVVPPTSILAITERKVISFSSKDSVYTLHSTMWRECIFREVNRKSEENRIGFHLLFVFAFTTSCSWDICIFLSPSTSNLPSITSEQKHSFIGSLIQILNKSKICKIIKFTNMFIEDSCHQFHKKALFSFTESQFRIH